MNDGSLSINISLNALWYILGALAIFGVFFFLRLGMWKVRSFFRGRKFDPTNRQGMQRRWAEIEQLVAAEGELQRKMAVLEADKLLDHALKALAMPGETLGERLKFAAYKYPNIKNVWWAHKIRNSLSHEATYHLDAGIAKRAIKEFRRALEMLGAL